MYSNENFKIAKYLIEQGIDINIQDNNNNTPLMMAVVRDNMPIIRLLINHKADLNKKSNYGKTVLMLAVRRGSNEMAQAGAKE